jgi:acetyl-CoA carboxylase biotin carboxyl carrier protein
MVVKNIKKLKKSKDLDVDTSITGIKDFISLTNKCSIASLSIGSKGKRITVTQIPGAKSIETNAEPAETTYTPVVYEKIKSKNIGSFHLGKGIAVGKQVKKGTTVATLHSVKIDHEIKADKDCTIKEILVKENDPIEYGQPLFFIE